MYLVKKSKIVSGLTPQDVNGAGAISGDYVSMKLYNHCTVILHFGAVGDAAAVTLTQAQDVSATGAKALAFTKQWANEGLTTDTFTETTVSSNTFNHAATASNLYVIEIDARELDVDNGFDCFKVGVAAQAGAATLLSILYILSEPRYEQDSLPSAIVD